MGPPKGKGAREVALSDSLLVFGDYCITMHVTEVDTGVFVVRIGPVSFVFYSMIPRLYRYEREREALEERGRAKPNPL